MNAVIFDLDGVLVDSRPMYSRLIAEALKSRGFEVAHDRVSEAAFPHVRKWMNSLVPEDTKDRERLLDELTREVRGNAALTKSGFKIQPDAVPILTAISQQHEIFLVTNSTSGFAENVLSTANLRRLFKKIITSSDGFKDKASAIEHLLAGQALKKDEVIYAGDTGEDVREGRRAGVRVVIVYTPFSWDYSDYRKIEDAGPDAIIPDLQALLKILEPDS